MAPWSSVITSPPFVLSSRILPACSTSHYSTRKSILPIPNHTIFLLSLFPDTERKIMEKIEHRTTSVNGIKMHYVESGTANTKAILLLHGFPEFWYSWRRQLPFLAANGYRAIAPDLRGCGDTDAPPSAASYIAAHVVGDLVALIDLLGLDKVFVVGHDRGAIVAWHMALFRPDKVKAMVALSVAFMPRDPVVKPVDELRMAFGDDFYICRFQNPGMNDELMGINTEKWIQKVLTLRDPTPPCVSKGGLPAVVSHASLSSLPSWLSEEDIKIYVEKIKQRGLTGGLNYYRAMDLNWELTAPWTGAQVKVPVKFMMGELDYTYNFPNGKDYLHNGGFKRDVPLLENVVIIDGAAHFLHQERPEVNNHILDFFNKF